MTLQIGDFVMQDGAISEIQRVRNRMYEGKAYFDGRIYDWDILPQAKRVSLKDLEYVRRDIEFGYIREPKNVKEFLTRLSHWCIANLT
jgi:hypothetical protein